jgi:hypothetical protein
MEILKCNADYNKVYYVEFKGSLHQCKLIRTELASDTPVYVLNIAQKGIVKIPANRNLYFNEWYRGSKIPSILYASIEDYQNGTPIIDDYGSTSNCYNAPFIDKLFKYCKPCNCGGSTITWIWRNCKAIQQMVHMRKVSWYWDCDGFHCSLNDLIGYYRTKEECERNSSISVVTF